MYQSFVFAQNMCLCFKSVVSVGEFIKRVVTLKVVVLFLILYNISSLRYELTSD